MIDFENAEYLKLKEADCETYAKNINEFLVAGEDIMLTYKAIRDGVVFTNKRIIVINVQGITGKKQDFTSLPYSKIQAYSIETSGIMDLDSELEVWFSGLGKVRFEFVSSSNIAMICKIISTYVL